MKGKPNNKGFTLVELIIAIAIMALLITAVCMIMSNNSVIFKKTKAEIRLQTVAEETYNELSNSIMQANVISITGSTTIGGTAYTYIKKPSDPSLVIAGQHYFDELYDESTKTYTTFYPTSIVIDYGIQYNDPVASEYTTAAAKVTYYFYRYTDDFGKDKVNMYISRECTTLSEYADQINFAVDPAWNPSQYAVDYSTAKSHMDAYKPWLYTNSLTNLSITVNAETQSVGINMGFEDQNRKYTSEGQANIRNSYVMHDKRIRN